VLARSDDDARTLGTGAKPIAGQATAAVAAAATGRALSAPHGVHPVHHILGLDDLPAEEINLDQANK
jgi:hypothetical protein